MRGRASMYTPRRSRRSRRAAKLGRGDSLTIRHKIIARHSSGRTVARIARPVALVGATVDRNGSEKLSTCAYWIDRWACARAARIPAPGASVPMDTSSYLLNVWIPGITRRLLCALTFPRDVDSPSASIYVTGIPTDTIGASLVDVLQI